jgi:xylan 1,4-beta-xylosidase
MFVGFRDLATNGIDKPVLNVFRMFGMMKGKRVQVTGNRMYDLKTFVDSSVRGLPDIGAIAAKDRRSATMMIWNYHDEDNPDENERISLSVEGLPLKKLTISLYSIDNEHSNSYRVWKKMGSPQNPTKEQIAELEKAGQLALNGKPWKFKTQNGEYHMTLWIQRQGVSFIKIEW